MSEAGGGIACGLTRELTGLTGAEPPSWWAPLHEQAANTSVFLSAQWMSSWLTGYGHEFTGRWVRWTDGGRTVAGCLLLSGQVRRRGIRLSALHLNTAETTTERSPIMEYNAPLILAGYERAVAIDLAALITELPWHCLYLSGHERSTFSDALFEHLPIARRMAECRPSPYLDLRAMPDGSPLAVMSSHTRQNVKRGLRMYESQGPLELRIAATLDEALADLNELGRLHNEAWARRGKVGAFAHPAYMAFQRRLVSHLWPLGAVHLTSLLVNGLPVGYLLNLVWRGKVYFVQSGYDYGGNSRLQPGMVTILLALDHYHRAGLDEFDFLAGESRYKRVFAKSERQLHWTVAFRRTIAMRLLLGANDAFTRLSGAMRDARARAAGARDNDSDSRAA